MFCLKNCMMGGFWRKVIYTKNYGRKKIVHFRKSNISRRKLYGLSKLRKRIKHKWKDEKIEYHLSYYRMVFYDTFLRFFATIFRVSCHFYEHYNISWSQPCAWHYSNDPLHFRNYVWFIVKYFCNRNHVHLTLSLKNILHFHKIIQKQRKPPTRIIIMEVSLFNCSDYLIQI